MALDRLRISLKRSPAMIVRRIAISDLKLVYVICANKSLAYELGRSPIVYIGTTKNGVSRIAQSAAYRADDVLNQHGVSSFNVRIVTCTPRRGVKTWMKLEKAMLLGFREMFGSVPFCNGTGHGFRETNEFDYFSRSRVDDILRNLAETRAAEDDEIVL